ncbi:hypothetical protein FNV43_RR14514 [Rhamnella rubrinervis]|uniref:Saccharopine dehydrogenase NADP binding domain-containing protein n=1 Tax=Rhamnella rubrinervis TaxID=2594499 RepID=A0A8K0H330_9ROSA|nr:hypothetical protein FNV43_RR14514 [Rhamnella rubrinervis]
MQEEQDHSRSPPYDLVILGASGFTGKYVVQEALRFLNTPSSPLKSFALAGRNLTKLTQTLEWATRPNPPPPIPILTADTTDPPSLHRLCAQTKLILNCVGPFRLYGEPVVAACAETGCDYLDICGEPEFMERMEAKYHEKAVETGSLVISACGFDSVPAELGLMFNSRQWIGPVNRVEAYLSLESDKRVVGNLATYESAVLGVANADQLQDLRRSRPKRARPVVMRTSNSDFKMCMVVCSYGANIKIRFVCLCCLFIINNESSTFLENLLHVESNKHQKNIGLWAVKLPSADSAVVRRTLATLTENPHGLPGLNESAEQIEKRKAFWSTVKPAHIGVKISSKSLLGIFRFMTVGIFIGLLGRFDFGRWLLLKFPSVFSLGWFKKKGPSEDEVRSASFKMWFIGHGFSDISLISQGNSKPDMEIVTRVMGPEIGYVTTPIILLQCALIVLNQRANLPKGGVYTPGIVFGPTGLQERLQQNGISFDVISKNAKSA